MTMILITSQLALDGPETGPFNLSYGSCTKLTGTIKLKSSFESGGYHSTNLNVFSSLYFFITKVFLWSQKKRFMVSDRQ